MPLKPQSLEEFIDQHEVRKDEDHFDARYIHHCVKKALDLLKYGVEPSVVALVCIAIGVTVGGKAGNAIIKDGYLAAKAIKEGV